MLPDLARRKFLEIVDKENYQESILARDKYANDFNYQTDKIPDAVITPSTIEQLVEIVKVCNHFTIPIITRNQFNKLSCRSIEINGGIIVLMNHFNKIEIDEKKFSAIVQSGVRIKDLHLECSKYNLFYPVLSTYLDGLSFGEIVSSKKHSMRSKRYGDSSNYILEFKIVLANGNFIKLKSASDRYNIGYNLIPLLIGSEGTLGIITEMKIQLIPKPEMKKRFVVSFQSFEDADKAFGEISRRSNLITNIEYFDVEAIQFVNSFTNNQFPENQPNLLLFELEGTREAVQEEIQEIKQICNQYFQSCITETIKSVSTSDDILQSLCQIKQSISIQRVEVPFIEVLKVIDEIKKIKGDQAAKFFIFGPIGDGKIYISYLREEKSYQEIKQIEYISHMISQKEAEVNQVNLTSFGQIDHQEGDIESKSMDPVTQTIIAIKNTFDPNRILNPDIPFANISRKKILHFN